MELNARQQAEFVRELTSHQAALQSYIISLMPGMSGVSDVMQETNLILWEKRNKFEPGSNFRAWAYAVARFEVKSHRRKLLKLGVPMLAEGLAEELADEGLENSQEFGQRLVALDHCIGQLGDEQRRLIEHRYFKQDTLEAFSQECGRTCESLRVSLFRIRASLRRCIEQNMKPISTENEF